MESPGMNSSSNEQAPESSIEETRAQYVQEVMKGQSPQDRAYLKDEKGQFASPSNKNSTLYVRDHHIEAARQEMNEDFAQREAQAEVRNDGARKERVETETPLRTATEIAMAGEGQIEQKYNTATQTPQQEIAPEVQTAGTPLRSAVEISNAGEGQIEQKYKAQEQSVERNLHQEALDRNAEANKIPSIEETLKAGKPRYNLKVQRTSGEVEDGWFATGVFQDQNGVDRVRVWKESQDGTVLRKDVKLEDLSQWNKESSSGLSEKGQQSLKDSDEIQNDLQGKSFKESLAELMDEESAQRYLRFLARDLPEGSAENVGLEQPIDAKTGEAPNIQQVFANIDQGLLQTQERLSRIENQIQEKNSKLAEIQGDESVTQEQLLEHMRLSLELQGLMNQRFDILLEQQKLNFEKSSALYEDLISKLDKGKQPETPETPEIPEIPETPAPGGASAETEQLRQQLDAQAQEVANPRRENTPEQRSAILGRQLTELDAIKENRPLTDQEKIQYFDLLEAKKTIDNQLQTVEQESIRKRNKKHKIIKIGAFVAGIGAGALTPPVSAAALIAVGLGGPIIGRQGIKLSEKLRTKSNSLKYADRRNKTVTELAQIDKRIKRNEWWANRLGEVSSALIGAGTGYGTGKAIQSIVNMLGTPSTPPVEQTPPGEGGIPSGQQGGLPEAPPTGEVTSPQGSIELPSTEPISTTGSELSSGDWLRTGELGWDTSKWGWRGPNLFVPQEGVVEGAVPDLQRKFLDLLSNSGVTKDMLYGQQAGEIFNQGLRSAVYTPGNSLQDIATATAEALKNLNP